MLQLKTWLRDYMKAHDLSALEVAESIGYHSNTPVSSVLRGERPVPLERLDEWARALKLSGEDKDTFRLLAHLQQAPDWLQEQYWRMRSRLDAIMAEQERSSQRNEKLAARLALAEQRCQSQEAELKAQETSGRRLNRRTGA